MKVINYTDINKTNNHLTPKESLNSDGHQLHIKNTMILDIGKPYRPVVENKKIKYNEPKGYTPISYVIGKRNDGTVRIMMP